jgi:two-component system chemotaxis response regulator CheB
VVVHTSARGHSALPAVLDRCGPLPAVPAEHGAPLVPGRIHVAVPDQHLLVRDGRILLSRAPRQNRARPAVDALFRSAARWRGPRTVGVVLSGALDDGAAGVAAIDAEGGAIVVQDPADAMHAGMPEAALAVVPDAVVAPAADLGDRIRVLVTERTTLAAFRSDGNLIKETIDQLGARPPEEPDPHRRP